MDTKEIRVIRSINGFIIIGTSHGGDEEAYVSLTLHDVNRKINELFYKNEKKKIGSTIEENNDEEVM